MIRFLLKSDQLIIIIIIEFDQLEEIRLIRFD